MIDTHPRRAIKMRRPRFSWANPATGLRIDERQAARDPAGQRSPYRRSLLPSLNCQKRQLSQAS
jgi:hypothetical protein